MAAGDSADRRTFDSNDRDSSTRIVGNATGTHRTRPGGEGARAVGIAAGGSWTASRGLKAVEVAIEQFGVLEKSLSQQVRQNSVASAPDKLSSFERRTLWQQIRFRLGVARLTQAKLGADIPADRATRLLTADEWLLPLAQGPSHERLTWESQLLLAEVARLRGDYERADKFLAAFEKSVADDTPLDLRERFVIERLRGSLAKRQPAEAASWLIEQGQKGVLKLGETKTEMVASPELTYWRVVVEMAVWQLAAERGDAKLAGELWSRATSEVEQLRRDDGGYWTVRAVGLAARARRATVRP